MLGFLGREGISLEEYNKGLVGFSSLVEKGFPGYFCVLVHGIYSCDLAFYNKLFMV